MYRIHTNKGGFFMINIREQGNRKTTYLTEFVVDTLTEIAELPVYPQTAKGSACLVLEDSSVYVLGGDNVWKKI